VREDPRVHRARVSSKRLRAAWRLARPALGKKTVRLQVRRLSAASRALSAFRDAETLRLLAAARRVRAPLPKLPDPGPALRRLEAALAASSADFLACGAEPRLGEGLPRSRRRLRKAARRARAARGAARAPALHAARRRAKDLQYQLELLARKKRERRRAKKAGRELGQARDLRRLAGRAHAPALGAEARLLERRALRRLPR
jgi:CHAD domain-containing protein